MPKLVDRKIIEIDLQQIEGGKVSIYNSLTASDIERILIDTDNGKKTSIILPLTLAIKDWNLEAEDGSKLPITVENVGKLDYKDINLIYKSLNLNSDFLAR